MTITDAVHQAVLKIPKKAWTPAYDAGGTERPGAWVAEITDMPVLSSRPKGMRLIVPHPGAQLRFTDLDGLRLTCFAPTPQPVSSPTWNCVTADGPAARIASAMPATPAMRNLPLHDTAQNRIWLEIVSLALELLTWLPMLALTGRTRRWEPKRLRLFSAAAQLVTTGRRRWLRFTTRWPCTDEIIRATERLRALPSPA